MLALHRKLRDSNHTYAFSLCLITHPVICVDIDYERSADFSRMTLCLPCHMTRYLCHMTSYYPWSHDIMLPSHMTSCLPCHMTCYPCHMTSYYPWSHDIILPSHMTSCLPGSFLWQCLSNTIPLTEYFLGENSNKPYEKHINAKNPLGMGGAIARAYGDLLEDLWGGKMSAVAPRNFKVCAPYRGVMAFGAMG